MADSQTLEIVPASTVAVDAQAAVFNRTLADYAGETSAMTSGMFQAFLFAQETDVEASRLAVRNGELVGFAYVQASGAELRIIAMGVVRNRLRQGIATDLLNTLVEVAKSRECRVVSLEVLERNTPAREFYFRRGFQVVSRLCGWHFAAGSLMAERHEFEDPPVECSLGELAGGGEESGHLTLPRPIRPGAMIRQPPTTRAFRRKNSFLVFSDPARPVVRICGLFSVGGEEPNWRELRSLLGPLLELLRSREWVAPAYFPEKYGVEVFRPLGFQKVAHDQLLLRRLL